MKRHLYLLALGSLLLATGCVKTPDDLPPNLPPANPTDMAELVIPEGFDYATTSLQTVQLEVLSPADEPIPNARVSLYSGIVGEGGTRLLTGQTDDQGAYEIDLPLAIIQEDLYAFVEYVGIPSTYAISLNDGFTKALLGGSTPGASSNVTVYDGSREDGSQWRTGKTDNFSNRYAYLGSYDSQGVPFYLTPARDVITQDLLDLVNTSLPEGEQVPVDNPQYIADSVNADTRLRDSASIWVTFVHEGAGYRNALGYYTYDMDNPPATSDDIDSLYIIFPNASYAGAGGGLVSGDKVYLGDFPANTGIGWFLVENGWNSGAQAVNNVPQTKFSNKDFNDYTTEPNRSHVALLKDTDREILLLGMEDITRPGGDKDFNDAVFYITANPFTAIITDNLAETQRAAGPDDDSDGVVNPNDDYPNDPNRAFDVFYPGENAFGTVAFEDLWPFRGDYDMNDMVVDYNYHLVTNTANRAIEINATLIVKAVGAGMNSGFGFVLDVDPNTISSVTGMEYQDNEITLSANGTEAGQSKSVIIAFDNGHALMEQSAGRFINTESSSSYITPDTLNIVITFNTPQRLSDIGYAPFNAFIFTERGRGYEIHLPDHEPTDLVDATLFGTGNDNTIPGSDRYYKDSRNLPWAIHVPSPFSYPVEKSAIINAHLRFSNWAQNAGEADTDWYENKGGYRNNVNIY